jgi:hypothetical protein
MRTNEDNLLVAREEAPAGAQAVFVPDEPHHRLSVLGSQKIADGAVMYLKFCFCFVLNQRCSKA